VNTSTEKTEPRPWTGFADQVLAILRCRSCKGALLQHENGLTCAVCQRRYPDVKGVVRFVDAEHYAGSFGFQWRGPLRCAESEHSEKSEGNRCAA
jgi:hypothetical protein